jgi:capsular polysaccharide biosynthesis protein
VFDPLEVNNVATIPITIVNEATLPSYPNAEALCSWPARTGRCELVPATARRVSQWSPSRFKKAGQPIPEWWQDDPIFPGRAVQLFRLNNAYYFPASGSVVSASGEAMESAIEEFRFSTQDHSLPPLPHMTRIDSSVSFTPPNILPRLRRAIVTMPAGAIENYGHFVLDCLSGVAATMSVRNLRVYPYVFPNLAPWQRRHLELVGVGSTRILTQPIYRVSRLLFTNAMAHNLQTPNVHFLMLRDIQLSNVIADVPSSFGDRIYISRRGARLRSFLNESELEAHLAALGFSIVQPEMYQVDQQIQMFRRAKVIVGPSGSAFANVLYCRPGTIVVEIVPTPMAAAWVGWLCTLTRARWRPYYCEGRSERTWAVQADLRFDVDKNQLLRHILNEIAV